MNRTNVIVTTYEWPAPPFSGANRKIHDVVRALSEPFKVTVITYGALPGAGPALEDYWAGAVDLVVLARRQCFPAARALVQRTLRSVTARRFREEREAIMMAARGHARSVLLVDGLSGLPILRYVESGAVSSLHDSMVDYFAIQASSSRRFDYYVLWSLRARAAARLCAHYLHRADAVHAVTEEDAARLRRAFPAIATSVIPILGALPVRSELFRDRCPSSERPQVLVWGNLSLGPVREGFRRLVSSPEWARLTSSAEVRVIGKISEHAFREAFPGHWQRVSYVERVEELETFLAECSVIVVPDVSGCGQKNRTLEAMRLGVCVAGFPEAFRGLPRGDTRCFLQDEDPDKLIRAIKDAAASGESRTVGSAGRALVDSLFGFEAFRAAWVALLDSVRPLALKA